ncbi:MAG TPA: IS1182 family transposase [Anaerolineales bacterium]|nr:IS1182 family transposase [Anaerolineales bacterium]
MRHRSGQNRQQFGLFATPLDEMIAPDNMVRVVDAFVDAIDLEKLGFVQVRAHQRGAPPYSPALLLKIYIYGYLNRVRSSRRLELECGRNIELMWLTGCQKPSYHTISDFRSIKPHRKALKEVFRLFNRVLDGAELFGKELVAIDGTKIRAQNSKKNNISEEKIQKRLDYHEARFVEYLDELDRADDAISRGEEPLVSPQTIHKALDEIQQRTQKLEGLLGLLHAAQAEDPALRQISLVDPDARSLPMNNLGHTDIAYNVQSAVDDKNYLVADFSVENISDVHLLSQTATAAKAALGVETLEVLADKGYHYGAELQKCADQQITTYVAYPDQDYKTKEEGFRKEDFEYDAAKDVYICPIGEELATNGTVYEKYGRNGQLQSRFRRYQLPYAKCKSCICAAFCLTESAHLTRHGRHIERSLDEAASQANRLRVLNGRHKYKRRQAIVEHPFGTIKRSWGFYYTLLKGKEKVNGEYSLVFLAYNMRRAVSILGMTDLLKRVKALFFEVFTLTAPVERLTPTRWKENFGVVWRRRADHSVAIAVRA